jgi:site-specific DNA-methyltransferase (adenine-specific)
MEKYLRICRECGFELHNILCWHKNNVTPSRWYMKNAEFTLFLRKGKAKKINNSGSKMIHEFDNIIGDKTHPTEKPVELMKFYIGNLSNEGDIVFDPFCGTGSTLVAAKELNRNYLGCEIDKEYFDIAEQRINNK